MDMNLKINLLIVARIGGDFRSDSRISSLTPSGIGREVKISFRSAFSDTAFNQFVLLGLLFSIFLFLTSFQGVVSDLAKVDYFFHGN